LVIDGTQSRGQSPRSITQGRAVVSMILRQAIADELIDSNPCAAVSRPKAKNPDKAIPDGSQVHAFLDAASDSPYALALLLAATTGARRSEVLGLRWKDVDLNAARVNIRGGLHYLPDKHEYGFLEPKSQNSRRTIALLPVVVDALRVHRQAQLERRLQCGEGWTDLDLVCERGDGAPISPDAVTKAFKRIARRADLTRARRSMISVTRFAPNSRGGRSTRRSLARSPVTQRCRSR
jgi:integrase